MIEPLIAAVGIVVGLTMGYAIWRPPVSRPSVWEPFGKEYIHPKWGRVMVVAPHPYDGAAWVFERQETTDPDDDDHVFDYDDHNCLTLADTQGQWPYLGFTKASAP